MSEFSSSRTSFIDIKKVITFLLNIGGKCSRCFYDIKINSQTLFPYKYLQPTNVRFCHLPQKYGIHLFIFLLLSEKQILGHLIRDEFGPKYFGPGLKWAMEIMARPGHGPKPMLAFGPGRAWAKFKINGPGWARPKLVWAYGQAGPRFPWPILGPGQNILAQTHP